MSRAKLARKRQARFRHELLTSVNANFRALASESAKKIELAGAFLRSQTDGGGERRQNHD